MSSYDDFSANPFEQSSLSSSPNFLSPSQTQYQGLDSLDVPQSTLLRRDRRALSHAGYNTRSPAHSPISRAGTSYGNTVADFDGNTFGADNDDDGMAQTALWNSDGIGGERVTMFRGSPSHNTLLGLTINTQNVARQYPRAIVDADDQQHLSPAVMMDRTINSSPGMNSGHFRSGYHMDGAMPGLRSVGQPIDSDFGSCAQGPGISYDTPQGVKPGPASTGGYHSYAMSQSSGSRSHHRFSQDGSDRPPLASTPASDVSPMFDARSEVSFGQPSPLPPQYSDFGSTFSGGWPEANSGMPPPPPSSSGTVGPMDIHNNSSQVIQDDSRSQPAMKKTREKTFWCDIHPCARNQPFGTRNDLERHKSSVHKIMPLNTSFRVYVCQGESCLKAGKDKQWPRKDNFKNHCKVAHKAEISDNKGLSDELLEDLVRRSETVTGPVAGSVTSSRSAPTIMSQSAASTDESRDVVMVDISSQLPLPPPSLTSPTPQPPPNPSPASEVSGLTVGNGRRPSLQIIPAAPPTADTAHSGLPQQNHALLSPSTPDKCSSHKAAKQAARKPSLDSSSGPVRAAAQGSSHLPQEATLHVDPQDVTRQTTHSLSVLSVSPRMAATAMTPAIDVPKQNLPNMSQVKLILQIIGFEPDSEAYRHHLLKVHEYLQVQNTVNGSRLPRQLKRNSLDAGFEPRFENPKPSPNIAGSPPKGGKASLQSGKPYTCKFSKCGKSFERKCNRRKHEDRHKKPWGCTATHCTMRFGSKSDWKRHENANHARPQKWICGERDENTRIKRCIANFTTRSEFKAHLINDHHIPEKTPPEKAPPKKAGSDDTSSEEEDAEPQAEATGAGPDTSDPTQQQQQQQQEELVDNPYLEKKLRRRRVRRNWTGSAWCGFCRKIFKLRNWNVAAWDERFDHIDDHIRGRTKKFDIDDWFPPDSDRTKGEIAANAELLNQSKVRAAQEKSSRDQSGSELDEEEEEDEAEDKKDEGGFEERDHHNHHEDCESDEDEDEDANEAASDTDHDASIAAADANRSCSNEAPLEEQDKKHPHDKLRAGSTTPKLSPTSPSLLSSPPLPQQQSTDAPSSSLSSSSSGVGGFDGPVSDTKRPAVGRSRASRSPRWACCDCKMGIMDVQLDTHCTYYGCQHQRCRGCIVEYYSAM